MSKGGFYEQLFNDAREMAASDLILFDECKDDLIASQMDMAKLIVKTQFNQSEKDLKTTIKADAQREAYELFCKRNTDRIRAEITQEIDPETIHMAAMTRLKKRNSK